MKNIDQSVTALAGELVAAGKDEMADLDNFKTCLATALHSEDWLINKRETPYLTTQTAGSLPPWAAGREITKTAGPFHDALGKLIWYDFYRIRHQLKIIRRGATDAFCSIPVDDDLLGGKVRNVLHLQTGSVWFIADQLTAGVPAGYFTGLAIHSGTIRFQGSISLTGDTITIGENDCCQLELELAQPVADTDISAPTGNDAKIMDIMLPEKLVVECHPAKVVFTEVSKIGLTIYGGSYHLSQTSRPSRFDSVLNRIFIALDNDKTQAAIRQCDSPFISLERSASLTENAWALPITQADSIDQLGAAAGIGGIALLTAPGLKISWKRLENAPVRCGYTYILTEPGRIAITVLAALAGHSSHSVQYAKQFELLYNCLSTSVEAMMMGELGSPGIQVEYAAPQWMAELGRSPSQFPHHTEM